MNTDQDILFTNAHAKLTSATITGKTGDIKFTGVPVLATVDLTGADAFDVMASGNASLSSWTDASKAEDRTFINNDLMTSVNLSATTKLSNSTDKSQTVEVSGNAELASLTLGMDDISTLNITDNAKLATISAAALKDNGSSTSTNVDIHQNALVADLVQNTKEAPTVTVTVGGATDSGAITTSSGIKTLDAYIDDAVGSTSGVVSVWFDTVSKAETQADYGGAFTDVTTSLVAPTSWTDSNAATNAIIQSSGYQGMYVYAFWRPLISDTDVTTGARLNEVRTYAYDVGRQASTYSDKPLASGEGLIVKYDGGTLTFKQGDTYNGSTVSTVDQLVAYINADTSLEDVGIDIAADRDAFKRTLVEMTYTVSGSNGLTYTAGAVSTAGRMAYTIGLTESSLTSILYTVETTAADAESQLMDDLKAALNASTEFVAADGTNADQLVVARTISGGTVADNSPIAGAVAITPIIDPLQVSTTTKLLTGNVSNAAAITSGNIVFTVTEEALSGVRVTLKNVGGTQFSTSVSLYSTSVSNSGIIADDGVAGANGLFGLLALGSNAPAYADDTPIGAYVTAFGSITAGTTTTTSGQTKVSIVRTTW